jgi:uncharacterized protein DUF4399
MESKNFPEIHERPVSREQCGGFVLPKSCSLGRLNVNAVHLQLKEENVMTRVWAAGAVSLLIVVGPIGSASGQTRLTGGPSASAPGAAVYFIDLKDGQTVPTKFTVHFGLKGMGVAPAGFDKANSGHHHLLIDTEVPPLDQPIPNDFNHLHFGGGQTETELTLTPGDHTLQLLLGDRNHMAHTTPLLSDLVHVHVVEGAQAPAPSAPHAGRHPSPPGAQEYFVYPTDEAEIAPTTVIRFGLTGMGIAPAGFEKLNTGHHHLLIDTDLPPFDQPIPSDFNHLHFGAGQTEAKITLSPGRHKLQLLLADENHLPHDPPVYSAPIRVTVTTASRQTAEVREVRTPVRKHKRRWRWEYFRED